MGQGTSIEPLVFGISKQSSKNRETNRETKRGDRLIGSPRVQRGQVVYLGRPRTQSQLARWEGSNVPLWPVLVEGEAV